MAARLTQAVAAAVLRAAGIRAEGEATPAVVAEAEVVVPTAVVVAVGAAVVVEEAAAITESTV